MSEGHRHIFGKLSRLHGYVYMILIDSGTLAGGSKTNLKKTVKIPKKIQRTQAESCILTLSLVVIVVVYMCSLGSIPTGQVCLKTDKPGWRK